MEHKHWAGSNIERRGTLGSPPPKYYTVECDKINNIQCIIYFNAIWSN